MPCRRWPIPLLATLLAILSVLYLWSGPGGLLPNLLGKGLNAILVIRASRLAAALATGVVLSCAGLLLQYSLRNPLADPFLLGVSPAALLAVALVALAAPGLTGFYAGVTIVSVMGGMAGLALVALVSRMGVSVHTVILAGVAVSTTLTGLSYAVSYIAATRLGWPPSHVLFGGFAGIVPEHALLLSATALAALIATLLLAPRLEALLYGDDAAVLIGVEPRRARLAALLAAGIPVAIATGVAGVIGFVGLIAPNAARRLTGCIEARVTALASALLGALIVAAADDASRMIGVFSGLGELPAGALIAVIGGVSLALLLRTG